MIYDSKGNINCAVVTGVTYVGAYSPEGYRNIILSDGLPKGVYHPCGALRVTVNNEDIYRGIYAPDGSINVTTLEINNGALKIKEAIGKVTETLAEASLSSETNGISIFFNDLSFYSSTGHYGSAYVKDTVVYNSHPFGLLTQSNPHENLLRGPTGIYRYSAHNLYLNSEAPANQTINIIQGAEYTIVITGSVSMQATGAYVGTFTNGSTTFTASTGVLTLNSTTGTGTVHLRRKDSDPLYVSTTGSAVYHLPFEWDKDGNLLGILQESGSTNQCYPSIPAQATGRWGTPFNNTTVITGMNDPWGGTSAIKLEATSTAVAQVRGSVVSTATSYSMSCIVKKSGGPTDYRYYGFYNNTTSTGLAFIRVNYDTKVAEVQSGTPVKYGVEDLGNGWLKVFISVNSGITVGNTVSFYVGQTGLSETIGSNLIVAHVQVEPLEEHTSPIRTFTSAVTKPFNALSYDIGSFPIGTSQTIVTTVRLNRLSQTNTYPEIINISDGTNNNRISIYTLFSTGITRAFAKSEGVLQADQADSVGTTMSVGDTYNSAARFSLNNVGYSVNGTSPGIDNTCTMPTPLTILKIGSTPDNSFINGHIKKVIILPRTSTDSELQTLSS